MEQAGAEQAGPRGRLSLRALCRAIREDVIQGVHRPGSRLTEEAMAARYGVSRVPVREALRTLEAEGFVRSRPYAGIVVVELDEAEAEDLLEVRALLEPLGAGRAALRRTPEQLGRLKELLSLGRAAIEDGRADEVARLNSRFHETIAAASGSRTLSRLVTQLSRKIAWVYSVDLPRRAEDSWREHEEIVAAVERGDPEAAREVVARHIAAARSSYRRRAPGPAGESA
ncbi:transcriptional regulator [Kitasatospora herbaricolor]|uniref:GntR family transcriptional regulator n=1 Tax=Kitasatospora herbaricolor TaxID=68217 RepID=UPI0017498D41|nr:GntR family transcriptional regulator [Kitasatospora herbaricolor]MDQ0313111.1 DNA-binding GntR family transcriptional regulator [Kitasatospora herbaricolor]GGV39978.1 transcriptional regulator [Kitasatospora herbaricolor]